MSGPAGASAPSVAVSAEPEALAVLISHAALLHAVSGGNLLQCFAAVGDPRKERGIRHPLPVILGVCTAAVLSGQVSLVDITDWVSRGCPQEVPRWVAICESGLGSVR
jgi:hypothetical protein